MKNHKNIIIASVIILAVLVFTYWWGGNSPGLHGWTVDKSTAQQSMTAEEKVALAEETAKEKEKQEKTEAPTQKSPEAPQEKLLPIEPETTNAADGEYTCTLSVRCDTILDNIEYLNPDKASIVPSNGIILSERTVTFKEGESVFDVLLRNMQDNKIHMEYTSTPMYSSAYIEGIANLYEFDCGELSGWMYRVNGWFPNYGCSRYQLKKGDKIEWIYTCDLGVDIGGYYSAGSNQSY